MWRLRRSERAETTLLYSQIHRLKADRLAGQVRSFEQPMPLLDSFTRITDEAAHAEASEAFERATYERNRDEVLLGRAIEADAREGDAFAKLARYERSLERSLFHTLDQLRRIQDERRNRVSSPVSDAITLDTENTE